MGLGSTGVRNTPDAREGRRAEDVSEVRGPNCKLRTEDSSQTCSYPRAARTCTTVHRSESVESWLSSRPRRNVTLLTSFLSAFDSKFQCRSPHDHE